MEEFLRRLVQKPFLWHSEEVRVFYQSNAQDIEKTLRLLPKQTPLGICTKYKDTFHFLSGKEINPEIITKIQNFLDFLKKVQALLQVNPSTILSLDSTPLLRL